MNKTNSDTTSPLGTRYQPAWQTVLVVWVLAAACTATLAQDVPTLKKIRDTGKIVLGVRENSPPMAYDIGGGKYVGYHVELCERIVESLRTKLKMPITIDYMAVTSQNRIPLVTNGTVDLECAATTNNLARQAQVGFGLTTFVTEVRMAVRAQSNITSIQQLNGRFVAASTGTTAVQLLRRHERGANIDFKEVYGKDHTESFLLLESGRAEAFVLDDNLLAGLISGARRPEDFRIAGEVLSVEPIAVMFRKDDPEFKKAVDDEIRAQMKSGALDKLYARWFLQPIPPKGQNVNLAMSAGLKALIANPNDLPYESYLKK